MIRQAHSYLAGAASSAALIAAGVVGFVVIAWLSPLPSLPLPDFGGSDTATPVSASPDGPPGPGGPTTASGRAGDATAGARTAGSGSGAAGSPGASSGQGGGEPIGSPGGLAENPGAAPAPSGGGRGEAPATTPQGSGQGLESGGGNVNSQAVTDAVNDAVAGADSATGGALQQTGVPGAAQGAVEGLVGPSSTTGQAVDGALGAVNEGLGGERR